MNDCNYSDVIDSFHANKHQIQLPVKRSKTHVPVITQPKLDKILTFTDVHSNKVHIYSRVLYLQLSSLVSMAFQTNMIYPVYFKNCASRLHIYWNSDHRLVCKAQKISIWGENITGKALSFPQQTILFVRNPKWRLPTLQKREGLGTRFS